MNRKRRPRFLFGPATFACAVVFPLFAMPNLAQQSIQVLHGHVPSAVSSGEARLIGPLPATQKLHVTISLTLRNEAALDGLIRRLYDPTSPDYRHFLSVAQFTQQFAPTISDYQAVVTFAQAQGLTVTEMATDRLIVPLDGTVEQVENALNELGLLKQPCI